LVVDSIGIKKQMNLALAHYSKADGSNIEEIEAFIVVVRDHLDLLARIFHQFDTQPYFSGSKTGGFIAIKDESGITRCARPEGTYSVSTLISITPPVGGKDGLSRKP